jgi:hypothetical protein
MDSTKFDPDDVGLSNDETAAILRVTPETLTTWRSKGRGPRYRKSGRVVEYTPRDPVTQKLTEAFVDAQAADGRDRIIFDSQLTSLGLRVTPTGTKIFIAQARVAGRKRRITMGFAPAMSLAKARAEAAHALVAMRNGVDPSLERKARLRAAAARGLTISQLAEKWMADFVTPKLKPRTAFDYRKLLRNTFYRHSAISRLPNSTATASTGWTSTWPTYRDARITRSPWFAH